MQNSQGKPLLSVRYVDIDEHSEGQRVDNFLLAQLKGVPRSRIYQILRKGEVRVNKGRIKPTYRLQSGDRVRIPPVRMAEKAPLPSVPSKLQTQLQQAVLHESEGVLVLNKPSGLAVHGGSGINLGLIEALRLIYPQYKRLELVHRLDRDTSGCILVATSRQALVHLHQQIRTGSLEKIYWVAVNGRWPQKSVVVDAPLYKFVLPSGERMVRVSSEGKVSRTRFELVERFSGLSLLRAHLETGRTHQIRVHCQHLGHPIIGDTKYNTDKINGEFAELGLGRLCLHASRLAFTQPKTGERIVVNAPLDESLGSVLTQLRNPAR